MSGDGSTYTVGVSVPDGTYEPVVEEMRCLTLGRVSESVWKDLMLKTTGTTSSSSQSLVHRLGHWMR